MSFVAEQYNMYIQGSNDLGVREIQVNRDMGQVLITLHSLGGNKVIIGMLGKHLGFVSIIQNDICKEAVVYRGIKSQWEGRHSGLFNKCKSLKTQKSMYDFLSYAISAMLDQNKEALWKKISDFGYIVDHQEEIDKRQKEVELSLRSKISHQEDEIYRLKYKIAMLEQENHEMALALAENCGIKIHRKARI